MLSARSKTDLPVLNLSEDRNHWGSSGPRGQCGCRLLAAAFSLAAWIAGAQPSGAPSNDHFTNRIFFSGSNAVATAVLQFASREAGEPVWNTRASGHTLWWGWVAPANGEVRLTAGGNGLEAVSQLFEGASLPQLAAVADSSVGFLTGMESWFRVRKATTYSIAVDALGDPWHGPDGQPVDPPPPGELSLELTFFPGPDNDDFAAASEFSGPNATVTGSNQYATDESGEPCFGMDTAGRTVWWKWTAPGNGLVTLSRAGSAIDLAMAVFAGEQVDRLQLIATNELVGCPPPRACLYPPPVSDTLTFLARGGATYHLGLDENWQRLYPFLQDAGGAYQLSLTLTPAPANDAFADRFSLVGTNVILAGSNLAASRDEGEPVPPGDAIGRSIWWSWIAPGDGMVIITNAGGSFTPLVLVFTGDSLARLAPVASNAYFYCWDYCPCRWLARAGLSFNVKAGTEYQIALDGYPSSGPAGDALVALSFIPAPPNDALADRLLLEGMVITVTNANFGASREPGEPRHAQHDGGGSVWYAWTATHNGRVTLSTNAPILYPPPTVTNIPSSYDQGEPVNPGSGSYLVGSTYGLWMTLVDRWWGWNSDAPFSCGNGHEPDPPPPFLPWFAVYTGDTLESLVPVAAGTNLSFDVTADTRYALAWEGDRGTMGEVVMNLVLTPTPTNDHFASAIRLSGGHVKVTGYNVGATSEPGEPRHGAGDGHSVWWAWTAPVGGRVRLIGSGDGSYPEVAVYTGDSPSSLSLVASSRGNTAAGLEFNSVARQIYSLAVDSPPEWIGNVALELEVLSVPTRLTAVRHGGHGAPITFRATGFPGQSSRLLFSEDLVNWRSVLEFVTSGEDEFVVPVVGDRPAGFFRIVTLIPPP